MPHLERPDGTLIHWEQRGEGPLLVFIQPMFSTPEVYEQLLGQLEREHRVVLYDARGVGKSSRVGPYDIDTDAADLGAVIEAAGGPAVVVASGESLHRAARMAAERPELISAVVNVGGTPTRPQGTYSQSSGLAGSTTVIEAFVQLISSDYRGGLRSAIAPANAQLDDAGVRSRIERLVEYAPREATLGRLDAWIHADSRDQARSLGDRLWVVNHGANAWFPEDLVDLIRTEVPEAHFVDAEDGPLSRPDITADAIRRAVAAAGVGARGC